MYNLYVKTPHSEWVYKTAVWGKDIDDAAEKAKYLFEEKEFDI